MISLGINTKVTRRFPYRTAQPLGIMLEFTYAHGNAVDQLQHELASITNARLDNHEGYELLNTATGTTYYVFFSDWVMRVSTDVNEGEW